MAPWLSPKNYEKNFFVRSKKNLFPVFSGVKDITPAKFKLDRFITVGGVDGQTYTPGPHWSFLMNSLLINYNGATL